jgi:hypothetical protein
MVRMIETSPWTEQPEPPPVKKYSIELYKSFYVVMREVAGKKVLVVVAVYKKGAEAVKLLVEGLERDKWNLRHENLHLKHAPTP